MLSREHMRSSRSPVLPTYASSSSASLPRARVGASGSSRGSAPALPGWPSPHASSYENRPGCLPSSARMVSLSDSLRLGSALPRGRRGYYGLCWLLTVRCCYGRPCSPLPLFEGRPAPLLSFPAREASRGRAHTFRLDTRRIYARGSRAAMGLRLVRQPHPPRPPDAVRVPRAEVSPTASFGFRLTTDTLAFGYALPAAGRAGDSHP